MRAAAKRERQFRQSQPMAGIFAIRSPSRKWIGCSRNIENSKQNLWFQLRNGVHRNTSLQHEWNLYGEESFAFEVLEEVQDDPSAGELEKELRRRREQWVRSVGALEL